MWTINRKLKNEVLLETRLKFYKTVAAAALLYCIVVKHWPGDRCTVF